MTHRWDYENPRNQWERWPWWFRWPILALFGMYFGSAIGLAVRVALEAGWL
jgi:hypothetical protein